MGEHNENDLHAALPRFLRRCDADSTKEAYRRELVRFIAWANGHRGHEILFDYRDALRECGLSPTTIRWRTTVARAFLLFAESQGYAEVGCVGDFKPPKGKSGFVPRVLSAPELKRLLAAPDRRSKRGRRDAAGLVCLGVGGLRAGEVCRLNREDLRIEAGRIVLHVNGKGRKQRLVTLTAEYTGLFQRYLASWPESRKKDGPLFWCGQPTHEDKRMTVAAVDYLVRTHAAAAGLPGIGAHTLRHTAASLAIDAGEPLHRLRDRLGHSSVLVTSRYLHVG
jgi:integrase/recombinase XerD